MRSGDQTFVRKSDAGRWLTLKEAEIKQGDWLAPGLSAIRFRDYAATWLCERVLKARTHELYEGLLRNHLLPTFGDVSLGKIDEAAARRGSSAPTVEFPAGLQRCVRASRTTGPPLS